MGVAVSLRRPDIRDDVLGQDPAGEAAIETGRRWALNEPVTRASCDINVFYPGNAVDAREVPTAVGLSVASAEGAWLARVGVYAGVVRCTVPDARGGGNSCLLYTSPSPRD